MAHDDRKKPSDPLEADTPAWNTVFLICKKCSKRRSAPHGVKAKLLLSIIRHGLPRQKPRPRVLFSSCLGVCPKGAMAVARIGGGNPRILSVVTPEQLEAALPGLCAAQP